MKQWFIPPSMAGSGISIRPSPNTWVPTCNLAQATHDLNNYGDASLCRWFTSVWLTFTAGVGSRHPGILARDSEYSVTRGWHMAGHNEAPGSHGSQDRWDQETVKEASRVWSWGWGGGAKTSPPGAHAAPQAHGHPPVLWLRLAIT